MAGGAEVDGGRVSPGIGEQGLVLVQKLELLVTLGDVAGTSESTGVSMGGHRDMTGTAQHCAVASILFPDMLFYDILMSVILILVTVNSIYAK